MIARRKNKYLEWEDYKFSRCTWGGEDKYISLHIPGEGEHLNVIYMYTCNQYRQRIPWSPCENDVLASDWMFYDEYRREYKLGPYEEPPLSSDIFADMSVRDDVLDVLNEIENILVLADKEYLPFKTVLNTVKSAYQRARLYGQITDDSGDDDG